MIEPPEFVASHRSLDVRLDLRTLLQESSQKFMSSRLRRLGGCQYVESSSRVKNLVLAHIVAIAALQTAEDNRRHDGQYSKSDESLMDSLNHFGRIGVRAGNEKRCG